MGAERYLVLVTNADLQVVGSPLDTWSTLDITLRFNEPGSGLMTIPADDYVRAQMQRGNRIVVARDDKYLIAGPIEKMLYERSDDQQNAGVGMLTVNWSDDLAKIAARTILPDPSLPPASQTGDTWTYTGGGEAALYQLVERVAGTLAPSWRQVPHLTVAPPTNVGTSITLTGQIQEFVGDVLRRGAAAAGDLCFTTVQLTNDKVVHFVVRAPRDLSGTVRFGFSQGNMRYQAIEVTAPSANAAITGGQGAGADRALIERVNQDSIDIWGRYETPVLRPGTSALAELQEAGDAALTDGAETVRVASSVSDLAGVTEFGRNYLVGDRVAQETWNGEQVVDVVRTVHIQAWSRAGEYTSASIGSQAAISTPDWIKRMAALDKRLAYVERNVTPS